MNIPRTAIVAIVIAAALGWPSPAGPRGKAQVTIVTGKTVLPRSWTWNLDKHLVGAEVKDNLWWATSGLAGAVELLGDQMFDNIDLALLKKVTFSKGRVAKEQLKPGTLLAARSATGNLAKLRVLRYFHSKEEFPEPTFTSVK